VVFTRAGVFVKHSATSRKRESLADPLQALLFNKDEPFRVSHPTEGGDDCTMFAFSLGAARDVVRLYDPAALDGANLFRVAHAPVSAATIARYRAMRAALHGNGLETLGIEEEGLALLAEALRAGYEAQGTASLVAREGTWRERRELVERTRQALVSGPEERWSLTRLARRVYSSPFHLTRVFRQHTGMPVHRFLVQLRLVLALERLDQGERDLTMLALSLGFSSHSHFTSAFRRAFGVPPSAFRADGPVRRRLLIRANRRV
jgi:AraC family transcriptional regulator